MPRSALNSCRPTKFARVLFTGLSLFLAPAAYGQPVVNPLAAAADRQTPAYSHIFVIVEENKNYEQILDPGSAPNIAGLAKAYGNATRFYGEVHPSEANYVALLGGDTFGIHDDDAYYCKPDSNRPFCGGARDAGYVDHTVYQPHLGDQLEAVGKTWKGYYESLPEPGSDAVIANPSAPQLGEAKTQLYASKHSGFMNFASVQTDPHRAQHIVGFDTLAEDMKAGALPNFALIVPNQCNEMHGLYGPNLPADCQGSNVSGLIRRGDAVVGDLVRQIQALPIWSSAENVAIVVTFDEGAGGSRGGCCSVTPEAKSNYGGGHIPTVVITNHGPKGVSDDTPYNHYSLLRTFEDAFRLPSYLKRAGDTQGGVQAMAPLFQVSKSLN